LLTVLRPTGQLIETDIDRKKVVGSWTRWYF